MVSLPMECKKGIITIAIRLVFWGGYKVNKIWKLTKRGPLDTREGVNGLKVKWVQILGLIDSAYFDSILLINI